MAELTGRELDRAVAEAMGWRPTGPTWPDVWNKPASDGNPAMTTALPPFSTDYACLPGMLAWLEARAYDLSMWWTDHAKRWSTNMKWNVGQYGRSGATLPEALARLVIEVARRQK
jgi:hypothetical protein